MVKLDAEHGDKGIHFVTAYTQFQSLETIEKYVADIGITFPVALDGFGDSRLSNRSLCHCWVVGVEGKVIYDGLQWEKVALAELKKVKYPMLGKHKVNKEVEPAATAFGKREYANAYKLASVVSYGDYSDEIIDEADFVIERIDEMADTLEMRAEVHEIEHRYAQSVRCWEKLEELFSGLEDRSDYTAETKRVKAIKDYASELKARREYINTRQSAWTLFNRVGNDDAKLLKAINSAAKLLNEFVESHPKASISDTAKDQATEYDNWAKSLQQKDK